MNSDCLGDKGEVEIGWEKTQRTSWEMVICYISYRHRGLGCTGVCVCWNSCNTKVKIYVFYYKFHLERKKRTANKFATLVNYIHTQVCT